LLSTFGNNPDIFEVGQKVVDFYFRNMLQLTYMCRYSLNSKIFYGLYARTPLKCGRGGKKKERRRGKCRGEEEMGWDQPETCYHDYLTKSNFPAGAPKSVSF